MLDSLGWMVTGITVLSATAAAWSVIPRPAPFCGRDVFEAVRNARRGGDTHAWTSVPSSAAMPAPDAPPEALEAVRVAQRLHTLAVGLSPELRASGQEVWAGARHHCVGVAPEAIPCTVDALRTLHAWLSSLGEVAPWVWEALGLWGALWSHLALAEIPGSLARALQQALPEDPGVRGVLVAQGGAGLLVLRALSIDLVLRDRVAGVVLVGCAVRGDARERGGAGLLACERWLETHFKHALLDTEIVGLTPYVSLALEDAGPPETQHFPKPGFDDREPEFIDRQPLGDVAAGAWSTDVAFALEWTVLLRITQIADA